MITRSQPYSLQENFEFYIQRVNTYLKKIMGDNPGAPDGLIEPMRYAVLGPGKRVRPLLTYASAELFQLDMKLADPIATAVELVHAYSLIHDDLPAMDDDDLRRGRATTHKKFGEAVAILTGDALQAVAFKVLCTDPFLSKNPITQVQVISLLARVAGPSGMVGGQLLDLEAEGHMIDESSLENIHQRKTGQLIKAAIMMPSKLANSSENTMKNLDKFASNIGLVFQIMDDLLEAEQNTTTLGKNARSDIRKEKSTYPSLLGISETRNRADKLYENAMNYLESLGENAAGLRWVANYIIERDR